MPIDPSKALAAKVPAQRSEWGPDNIIILYHLGVGAGFEKPTDAKELEYTYEQNLKVLPSYGVTPLLGTVSGLDGIPGIDINFMMVLHGERLLMAAKTKERDTPVVTNAAIELRTTPDAHKRKV